MKKVFGDDEPQRRFVLKKTRRFMSALLFVFSILSLTACYDKVELENRAFVISIGIDKGDEEKFNITLNIPDLQKEESDESINISESDNSVYSAMNEIDANISKKVYYGQTKFVVIGKEVLENADMFKEVIDTLERNSEISRKITVLVSDRKAEDVLKGEVQEKSMIGSFIADYYINYDTKNRKIFKQTIEDAVLHLRSSDSVVLPKITLKDNNIRIGGAAVIKDFRLAGFLEEEDLKGYLFFKGLAKRMTIQAQYKDAYIPLKITGVNTKVKCYEKEDNLYCDVELKCSGKIEEFIFGEKDLYTEKAKLELLLQEVIKSDILKTGKIFSEKYSVDGFGIEEILRKYNNELYLKYKNNMEDKIKNVVINPIIDVEIRNTGSVK